MHIMMDKLAGDKAVSRGFLETLPMPESLGARHNPVPYIDTVNLLTESLVSFGLHITQESFVLTKENQKIFGLFELSTVSKEFALMLGMRGSINQSMAWSIATGAGVFVCTNLVFTSEIVLKTKHTTFINDRMPAMVNDAVSRVPAMVEIQQRKFDSYKMTKLSNRQGDAAITELVRRGVVLPQQVGRVIHEWDNPTHEEHAEDGRSVWRLNNAVTEAMKPGEGRSIIQAAMERTQLLTVFCDEIVTSLSK